MGLNDKKVAKKFLKGLKVELLKEQKVTKRA